MRAACPDGMLKGFFEPLQSLLTLFPLNFSSAGKGPFMASTGTLSWGEGGSGARDMAPPLLGNIGAKFSETSSPHFKTYFTQIGHCHLKTTI